MSRCAGGIGATSKMYWEWRNCWLQKPERIITRACSESFVLVARVWFASLTRTAVAIFLMFARSRELPTFCVA